MESGQADPLEVHEVVGQLHELDLLVHAPGQCLLVQWDVAHIGGMQVKRFLDVGVALVLVRLGLDLEGQLVHLGVAICP